MNIFPQTLQEIVNHAASDNKHDMSQSKKLESIEKALLKEPTESVSEDAFLQMILSKDNYDSFDINYNSREEGENKYIITDYISDELIPPTQNIEFHVDVGNKDVIKALVNSNWGKDKHVYINNDVFSLYDPGPTITFELRDRITNIGCNPKLPLFVKSNKNDNLSEDTINTPLELLGIKYDQEWNIINCAGHLTLIDGNKRYVFDTHSASKDGCKSGIPKQVHAAAKYIGDSAQVLSCVLPETNNVMCFEDAECLGDNPVTKIFYSYDRLAIAKALMTGVNMVIYEHSRQDPTKPYTLTIYKRKDFFMDDELDAKIAALQAEISKKPNIEQIDEYKRKAHEFISKMNNMFFDEPIKYYSFLLGLSKQIIKIAPIFDINDIRVPDGPGVPVGDVVDGDDFKLILEKRRALKQIIELMEKIIVIEDEAEGIRSKRNKYKKLQEAEVYMEEVKSLLEENKLEAKDGNDFKEELTKLETDITTTYKKINEQRKLKLLQLQNLKTALLKYPSDNLISDIEILTYDIDILVLLGKHSHDSLTPRRYQRKYDYSETQLDTIIHAYNMLLPHELAYDFIKNFTLFYNSLVDESYKNFKEVAKMLLPIPMEGGKIRKTQKGGNLNELLINPYVNLELMNVCTDILSIIGRVDMGGDGDGGGGGVVEGDVIVGINYLYNELMNVVLCVDGVCDLRSISEKYIKYLVENGEEAKLRMIADNVEGIKADAEARIIEEAADGYETEEPARIAADGYETVDDYGYETVDDEVYNNSKYFKPQTGHKVRRIGRKRPHALGQNFVADTPIIVGTKSKILHSGGKKTKKKQRKISKITKKKQTRRKITKPKKKQTRRKITKPKNTKSSKKRRTRKSTSKK